MPRILYNLVNFGMTIFRLQKVEIDLPRVTLNQSKDQPGCVLTVKTMQNIYSTRIENKDHNRVLSTAKYKTLSKLPTPRGKWLKINCRPTHN